MKILNFPRSDKIDYLNIRLEKKHYFKIDDHVNKIGHEYIAAEIEKYLQK